MAPATDAPPLPSEPAPVARPIPSAIPEIDPALAHLLPPEQRGVDGAPLPLNSLRRAPIDMHYSFTALDEYNRAKRFSEAYFNVDAWEKEKAAEAFKRKAAEEAGTLPEKKITKKDMVSRNQRTLRDNASNRTDSRIGLGPRMQRRRRADGHGYMIRWDVIVCRNGRWTQGPEVAPSAVSPPSSVA